MIDSISLIKAGSAPVFNVYELNLGGKAESIFNFVVVLETPLKKYLIKFILDSSYFLFQFTVSVCYLSIHTFLLIFFI